MTAALLAALLLPAAFGLLAPRLARRLPPATAVWLLSGGAALAAGASSAALGLLAFLPLAPVFAAQGQLSDQVLRRHYHPPVFVGVLAVVAVLALAARFGLVALRRAAALRDAYRLAGSLAATELCVLDLPHREALAVPGRPGRIVLTRGLLRALTSEQRRAVLAHERAHLSRWHHLHQSVAALAVALNPLLRRIGPALELACERDADETAAAGSSRAAVASALARLVERPARRRSPVVLAAATGDLGHRIGALGLAPVRLQAWRVAVLTGLLAAAGIAVAIALQDTDHLVDLARAAYRTTHR